MINQSALIILLSSAALELVQKLDRKGNIWLSFLQSTLSIITSRGLSTDEDMTNFGSTSFLKVYPGYNNDVFSSKLRLPYSSIVFFLTIGNELINY